MTDKAKKLFNAMLAAMARTYGVESVGERFSVTPSIGQILRDKIVELSTFLQHINYIGVTEIEGENILGSASRPVSSRTKTSDDNKERKPINVLGLEAGRYKCVQTNRDIAIRYATIDAWAKFPDLPERYLRYFLERWANDVELIGWHGKTAAENTNFTTYPLLEDVNVGWMEYMRIAKPENILVEGKTTGEIRIGKDGDYKNLDLVVHDLKQGVPEFMRSNLVALVGSDLIAKEEGVLFDAVGQTPTEKIVIDNAMTRLGGLPWASPSNFPARGIVVTSYDNLSIYQQDGTHRRQVIDNPKKDQVEDYNSVNEGYVVEEAQKFTALEFGNVKVPDGNGGWE